MKKYILPALALLLNVVLLFQVHLLSGEVKTLKSSLRDVEAELENDISRIPDRIFAKLEEAAELHESFELKPTGLDKETESLLADFEVRLKQWSADTEVTLLVGGQEVSLTAGEPGCFTAPLSLPIGGDEAVELSIDVTTAGVTTREYLGGWEDVSMLLPLRLDGWGYSGPYLQDGVFTCDSIDVNMHGAQGGPGRVRDAVFSIYVNGERKMTGGSIDVTAVDSMTLEGVELGDEVTVTFSCRDEYGLHYEFDLFTWIAEETNSDGYSAVASDGSSIPKLSWD